MFFFVKTSPLSFNFLIYIIKYMKIATISFPIFVQNDSDMRRYFLCISFAVFFLASCAPKDRVTSCSTNPDRNLWITTMDKVCRPVLTNLAGATLKQNMPIEGTSTEGKENCTYLEALGRVMVGIAPWLELGPDDTPEGQLRAEYIDLSVKAISNAVNPESPDFLNFCNGGQPLVDAAFLAHGLLRAPTQVFARLSGKAKADLKAALESSRAIRAYESNWLLFSAMVEAALLEFYGEHSQVPVDYALGRFLNEWYLGDGMYGDGPEFHYDYYNSFVIQPMMVEILGIMKKHGIDGAEHYDEVLQRYSRYAAIQERLISPEGTYPVTGRSLAYRFGAFHALSDAALRGILPESICPAQVRCALSAVIERQINAPGTFDENGWLTVGFCGHQLHIGEGYISTGSLYLCTEGLVALGLPETDPFWSDPAADWTCKKAWNGTDLQTDHAL